MFLGKKVGVFGFVQRPAHAGWAHIYGVALMCGIGFTMSLFIGLLAFAGTPAVEAETKVGVLVGSLTCMVLGAMVLRFSPAAEMPRRSASP
ncbi:hypothetical protein ASF55_17780 [Methylobacterium sp. Leaf119]|nr:Na+/H+ antiporter [Methylorubrum extorquens PA1]KQP94535.1 hypothetical protein ASF55_17780 [Methylobacterium sp. Leaf119]WIU40305.1 Na+/H+ antiporter NhaA [Methylorubrum extorquens]